MVTDETPAALPLRPWLGEPLRAALASQQAHAIWLHGPAGVGQFDLALALAQAWLCPSTLCPARPVACAPAVVWCVHARTPT